MANMLPETGSNETIVEFGRFGALSDGVFAIALTLLVLDIRLPDGITVETLPASLLELAPRILIYLISFIVIGGAWGSHQRMVSQFKRGDGVLVWLNLLSLLFVTLLPASAALLGRFPGAFIAIIAFALDVILIQLSALWLWRHAASGRLINPALDSRVIISIGRRLLLSAGAFALSVPLALLSAPLVYIVWIALFVLVFATDWLTWQQATKTTNATIPLEGALHAQLNLIHSAGTLNLQAGAAKDQLLNGAFGGGVDVNSTRQGDLLKTQLTAVARQGLLNLRYPWSWGSVASQDWEVVLNRDVPLMLNLEMSTNQVSLDFRDTHLEALKVTASASYIDLWLPEKTGLTTVAIQGSAASFVIHVPATVAIHVRASKSISGMQVDLSRFQMITAEREYRSPDYDSAVNKIDIELEVALGSAQIL
jgi:uncharacterized membrane protein